MEKGTGTARLPPGRRGPARSGLWLVLVAVLVLTPADALFRGVDSTVDLLVVLMVGVALGEPRYFVDPLFGLFWVLLGVGLRLLLQVVEFAHIVLLSHRAGRGPWLVSPHLGQDLGGEEVEGASSRPSAPGRTGQRLSARASWALLIDERPLMLRWRASE